LQPRGYFRTILDVICTKYLPDFEQLLPRRFFEIPGKDKIENYLAEFAVN